MNVKRSLRGLGFGAAVALALTMLFPANTATAQTLFRPVAIVNDSAITGFDLAQRAIKELSVSAPLRKATSVRSKMRSIGSS